MYGVAANAPAPDIVRSDGLFRSFPVILFAYSCQTSLFPIMSEVRSDVRPRSLRIVAVSFMIAFTLYTLATLFGYLLFGANVQDNVLLSIASVPNSPVVPVLLAFSFVIITSYPLIAFTSRLALENLFFRDHKVVTERGWLISTWLFVVATFLALSGISLGFVLSLTGSIASSSLTLVLPAVIYLRLLPDAPLWRRVCAALLGALGLAIGIAGLVDTFSSLGSDGTTPMPTTVMNATTTMAETSTTMMTAVMSTTLTTLSSSTATSTTAAMPTSTTIAPISS